MAVTCTDVPQGSIVIHLNLSPWGSVWGSRLAPRTSDSCVGSVDAFHCGFGSWLTLLGRGAGTWLTLAPVAGRQWVQDLLDTPVVRGVWTEVPVVFSFAVGVRACRSEGGRPCWWSWDWWSSAIRRCRRSWSTG